MSTVKFDTDGNRIIETIQQSVATQVIDAQPGDYTTREIYRVPLLPLADCLVLSSLDSLVQYVNESIDEGALTEDAFIQIVSPWEVYFRCGISSPEQRRFTPVIANFNPPRLQLNEYRPQESIIIMLQTLFSDTPQRAVLLAKLGNIAHEEELTQEDDGVTQQIVVQKGVKRMAESIINPVYLRPFRTFHEIEQPESPFVVRIQNDVGIEIALYEADGGFWKWAASGSIHKYLQDHLTKALPILY